jgi:uncharacterized membrane protein YbhN (UPF0104 family)
MTKRVAITLLRVAVSASILVFILSRVSFGELAAHARGAAYPELAAVVLLYVAMALLVALRWRVLAIWLGLELPARLAVRAMFLGLFGGQLLPSSVGTDVLRGWVVGRQTGRIRLVAASLVADRLVAFCGASLLLAFAYAFVVRGSPPLPRAVVSAAALAVAGLLAGLLIGSADWLRRLRTAAFALFRQLGVIEAVQPRPAPVVLGIAMAVLIHATATLAAAASAAAYGLDSSLATWLAIMPVSVIASALPVSINGWGVREGVIMALGAGQGLAPADALLVSLTLGAGNILASLPGAYLLLCEPRAAATGT